MAPPAIPATDRRAGPGGAATSGPSGVERRGRGRYRGADRRRGAELDPRVGFVALLGTVLLVVVWAVVAGTATFGHAAPAAVEAAVAPLRAAGVVLAVMGAWSCLSRARLSGEALPVLAGPALLLLAGATVLAGGTRADGALLSAGGALAMSALALFTAGLRLPTVDTRIRLRRTLLVAVVTVAAAAATRLAMAAVTGDPQPVAATAWRAGAVESAVALLLAAAYLLVAVRHRRWLTAGLGLTLLGWCLAAVATAASPAMPHVWLPGAELLRVVGFVSALVGISRETEHSFAVQRSSLLRSIADRESAAAVLRAEREAADERAHEARSALLAIEGAAASLGRYAGALDEESRVAINTAVSAEIGRLQRLIEPPDAQSRPEVFDVAALLAAEVTVERLADAQIRFSVGLGLMAVGSPFDTAGVVRNLLVNARRHAPGSPVDVSVARNGGLIEIRVSDRGPGVRDDEKEAIFRRGYRGRDSAGVPGSGLGLSVSCRLMREQGGDLRVEDRPGGGAAFVATLPAA